MINDISILRASLYKVVEANAKGLTGPEVIRVLKTVSEDMFEAGIDEALRNAEKDISKWENIADAWDLTWLTVLGLKLKEYKEHVKFSKI